MSGSLEFTEVGAESRRMVCTLVDGCVAVALTGTFQAMSAGQAHELADWIKANVPPPVRWEVRSSPWDVDLWVDGQLFAYVNEAGMSVLASSEQVNAVESELLGTMVAELLRVYRERVAVDG